MISLHYITPKNTEITVKDSLSKKIYKTNIIYEFFGIIKCNSQTSVKSTTYLHWYLSNIIFGHIFFDQQYSNETNIVSEDFYF